MSSMKGKVLRRRVLTVAARPGEAVYLTDAAGRAVYYIASPDDAAAVECTGECTAAFDPVSGKAIGPVTSAPSTARWTVPPVPLDATRKPTLWVPADRTFTVKASHSPARIDFTL